MIVVVSAHDKKYEPLAEWTLYKNKLQYCLKHGYKLHYSNDCGAKACGKPVIAKLPPIPDTHVPAGWGKIFVMIEAMEKYPEAEWIFNTDCDVMITNTIIAGMPLYRHWYMFENQLIQDLFIGTHLEETGVVQSGTFWNRVGKILPQRVMNSYDYKNLPRLKERTNFKDILGTDGQWQEGDFLIQWPSTDLEFRIKAAKEMFPKVIK